MRDQAGSYCHRLATRILQINNLQPELQNSAAPSTRGCNTVSCLHLVCPIPSYTPWDQDQFISFLTNGTYVQAQSRCSHISAPSHTVLEKHLLRQHSPSLPASTSPPSFPSTPLFLPCPYPTSSPLAFLAPTPLLPPPHLPPCLPTLTSLYTWSCQHLLQEVLHDPGRSNKVPSWGSSGTTGLRVPQYKDFYPLRSLLYPEYLAQYKVHHRSSSDLLSE